MSEPPSDTSDTGPVASPWEEPVLDGALYPVANTATVEDLGAAVSCLRLAVFLLDLNDSTIIAVSQVFADELGMEQSTVRGKKVTELVVEEDRPLVEAAVEATRSGNIDFYRAYRHLISPLSDEPKSVPLMVRAFDLGESRVALVSAMFDSDSAAPSLLDQLGGWPITMAIGMADRSWTITAISSDIRELADLDRGDLVGTPLLAPAQQESLDRLLQPSDLAGESCSAAVTVELPVEGRVKHRLCCVITSLVTSSGRCFVLVPSRVPEALRRSDQVDALEQHLWRIAAEVAASGILRRVGTLPDPGRFDELGTLTTRQWEVLSRLLRGQRVPTIAAEMFLSQSTVRNHLSAIYQRFGVHSQAQLLALLTGRADVETY